MPADTYDSILGVLLMGTGNDNNAWGSNANDFVFKMLSRAIGGTATHTDTGGTLDLSTVVPPAGARLDMDYIHNFTGVLVSALTVIVPAVSKTWMFRNNTSGSFYMYVKTPAGTAVQVPNGKAVVLFCDGTNVKRADEHEIGTIVHSGATAAPAGTIQCAGGSFLRTDLPDLFAKIGTTWGAVDGTHFTLPDFYTTSRFLRSANASLAVGTYQANQNAAHVHSLSGIPGLGTLAIDSGGAHTHTATSTDSGHTHSTQARSQETIGHQYGGGPSGNDTAGTTGSGTANITTTVNSGGAHVHTVSGALTLGSMAVVTQGGSEARPDAAVVMISIKY